MRPISNDMQNRIVQLLKEGVSGEEISTKTGVSTGTISKIRKNHDLGDLKTNGGRPFVISTLLGRRILRNFNSGNYKNASDAARKLLEDGENISAETIRRFLKESGYAAIHKPKFLPLTKHRMKERYEFAGAHLSRTIDDWKKVIFSDETKVNRIGSDGLQWTWTNGDKLKDFQVQHMIKHGGGSLMLWGCLTWYGVGYLSNIKGSINSDFYIGILEDELMKTFDWYDLQKEDIIFQQDNASIHTAKEVSEWLENNNISVLRWPPHSPDLNPIENLWSILKRRLLQYEKQPDGMLELWSRIENVWESITQNECQKLIESMPKRIKAVYNAKGGHTKY
ncbi:hypothetical protein G6F16_012601 [Rhizopus arrhizus]|nr:hypothetical protein G6F19_012757 [Rhizopus arrhizus]KAG0862344.1 hypothetical protein G6F16_012601 [Rhizopus arrhizus]KAG1092463.1 hypothetical protein G6F40_012820 [Rhizopus arrhizus]